MLLCKDIQDKETENKIYSQCNVKKYPAYISYELVFYVLEVGHCLNCRYIIVSDLGKNININVFALNYIR